MPPENLSQTNRLNASVNPQIAPQFSRLLSQEMRKGNFQSVPPPTGSFRGSNNIIAHYDAASLPIYRKFQL